MGDDTTLGTVVLGLDGFALREAMLVDGEVWLAVESTGRTPGCPDCGVVATPHDRRTVQLRDLPIGGRPCRLVWSKRIWRCHEPLCPRATWTERRDDVARPRHAMTERARAKVCRQVGRLGRPVAQLAWEYGVGWQAAMNAVIDHGVPLIDDPDRTAGVSALGVDETSFLKASHSQRRRTTFVTGLVDLRRSRLLDIVPGRAGSAVTGWLAEREEPWLSAVEKVALDPHRGYLNALVGGLDAPTVVVDAFHIIKLANTVVDEVRRRVQQEQTGHRGFSGDPLYGIRRVLLTGAERLSERGRARIDAGLDAGDPDCEVWYAHMIKEQLRDVYRADGLEAATERLEVFFDDVAAVEIPEVRRLGRTIRRWRQEVLAYFPTDGLSNGRTEAINGLVKRIKRIGHGFRNIGNYRIRLLLFCGGVSWQDQPTAHIRRRSPRLIA
jgi:transposase